MKETVQVTREDRDEAHAIAVAWDAGRYDEAGSIVARHRLSATSAPAGVERLALEAIKAVTATTKDAVAGLSRIMAIARSAGVDAPYSELMAKPEVALIVNEPRTDWRHLFEQPVECTIPPTGWRCTRAPGHDGPCAAVTTATPGALNPATVAPSCATGVREAAQAVLDSAQRPGSRAEYGIGKDGAEVWHDYQEVAQTALDKLTEALATDPHQHGGKGA